MKNFTAEEKEDLIQILSHFETRSSKDIQFLMKMAFKAGEGKEYSNYEQWFDCVKRELLNL